MNKVIKWLVVSVTIMLVAAFAVTVAFAVENTTEFAGGDGTEANPYLISTKVHLNNVRNHLDAHFKMTADIVFADADFAAGGAFHNDCANCPPHYGYRYGRWYYGHGHIYGCQRGGNRGGG